MGSSGTWAKKGLATNMAGFFQDSLVAGWYTYPSEK